MPLQFASQAKLVKTKPIVNEHLNDEAKIKQLEKDKKNLRQEVERLVNNLKNFMLFSFLSNFLHIPFYIMYIQNSIHQDFNVVIN